MDDISQAAQDLLQRVSVVNANERNEVARSWFEDIRATRSKEFANEAFALFQLFEAGYRTGEAMAPKGYAPSTLERAVPLVMGSLIIVTVLWLALRNEPFKDANVVVMLRILLSLAAGICGAFIPGFLNIEWTGQGAKARAGGALAFALLTYVATPKVLPKEIATETKQSSVITSPSNYAVGVGNHVFSPTAST